MTEHRLVFSSASINGGDGTLLVDVNCLDIVRSAVIGAYDLGFTAADELGRWILGASVGMRGVTRQGVLLWNGQPSEGSFRPLECAYVTQAFIAESSGYAETPSDELAISLELQGVPLQRVGVKTEWFLNTFHLDVVRNDEIEWLSGGQRQRLTIAAALILNPRRMALLSTLSELDPAFRGRLITYLRSYAVIYGATALVSLNSGELEDSCFDALVGPPVSKVVETRPPALAQLSAVDEDILSVSLRGFVYKNAAKSMLADIDFCLRRGQVLFIQGVNGAGKTTLARILTATTPGWKNYSGSILFSGEELRGLREAELWAQIGYVPQDPTDYFSRPSLQQELSAYSNPIDQQLQRALLELLGLTHLLDANPFDLDPVQRKKLSLVIAARTAPKVLILDEPTQYQSRNDVAQTISAIDAVRSYGTSVVCITHDQRLVKAYQLANILVVGQNVDNLKTRMNEPSEQHPQTRFGAYVCRLQTNGVTRETSDLRDFVRTDWEEQFSAWSKAFMNILDNWSRRVYPVLDLALTEYLRTDFVGSLNRKRYVDFGCGNGWQTMYTLGKIQEAGGAASGIGLDFNRASIECASGLSQGLRYVDFQCADCTSRDEVRDSLSKFEAGLTELASAYFVLHDSDDAEGLIRVMADTLVDGGVLLIAIINPRWVEMNLASPNGQAIGFRSQDSRVTARTKSDWVGEYVIADGAGGRATLPYFHRSLDVYARMLQRVSLKVTTVGWAEGHPSRSVRQMSVADGWPRSVPAEPQSILITCRKMSA